MIKYLRTSPKGPRPDKMDINHPSCRIHFTDATKFYVYRWGTPILQYCKSGTYFNPNTCSCHRSIEDVLPTFIGCESSDTNSMETQFPTCFYDLISDKTTPHEITAFTFTSKLTTSSTTFEETTTRETFETTTPVNIFEYTTTQEVSRQTTTTGIHEAPSSMPTTNSKTTIPSVSQQTTSQEILPEDTCVVDYESTTSTISTVFNSTQFSPTSKLTSFSTTTKKLVLLLPQRHLRPRQNQVHVWKMCFRGDWLFWISWRCHTVLSMR